jgi:hypothetical protein
MTISMTTFVKIKVGYNNNNNNINNFLFFQFLQSPGQHYRNVVCGSKKMKNEEQHEDGCLLGCCAV